MCAAGVAQVWFSPRANRLEKSVSVRRKRASLSLLSHESKFFWPASLPFSSRLLFFCRNPRVLHGGGQELSPNISIPHARTNTELWDRNGEKKKKKGKKENEKEREIMVRPRL